MGWNNGYMTQVEYVPSFYVEQSPVYLNFSCVLNGIEPVAIDREFTCFELGFGLGVTANVLAAANPQGRFYAADFNPAHVVAARELAQDARLDNLVLLENSFAELAEGKVDLPQFDFITAHGIYSWVSPDSRRQVVNFLARYLKPGGIFYVSYNAMPGWASALPLHRLVRELGMQPGGVDVQLGKVREVISALDKVQANYFIQNTAPMLRDRVASIHGDNAGYLAHEYMNQGWEALYYMDVARDLANAKLDFACSAITVDAFPRLVFTAAQRELLAGIPDEGLRETAKDYIANVAFRRDVFVRGARRMTPKRRLALLATAGLALTEARDAIPADIRLASGETIDTSTYAAALDALEDGPKTFAELASLPGFCRTGIEGVAEMAAILIALRKACPYFISCAGNDPAPAHRLNRVVARRAEDGDRYPALAAPLLGNGVRSTRLQRLIYGALCDQPDELDVDALIDGAWRNVMEPRCSDSGQASAGATKENTRAEVADAVEEILTYQVPLWSQLNALGGNSDSSPVEHSIAGTDYRIVDMDGNRYLFAQGDSGDAMNMMDLARPDVLMAPYMRVMLRAVAIHPQASDLLLIGLGGGQQAKFVHDRMPHRRLVAVEIDPAMVGIARTWFGLPEDDERLQVVVSDGAAYVAAHPGSFDIVLCDGYDQAFDIPGSLASAGFYRACHAALRHSGIVAINLLRKDKGSVDEHTRMLREVFDECIEFVVSPVQTVLLAAKALPHIAWAELAGRTDWLDAC
jgi:SAM-dependent methyltransferase